MLSVGWEAGTYQYRHPIDHTVKNVKNLAGVAYGATKTIVSAGVSSSMQMAMPMVAAYQQTKAVVDAYKKGNLGTAVLEAAPVTGTFLSLQRAIGQYEQGNWFGGGAGMGETIVRAEGDAALAHGGVSWANAEIEASIAESTSFEISSISDVVPGAVDAVIDSALYARGSFWKAAARNAKAAALTNEFGQMICPTCQEVIPQKITVMTKNGPRLRRGWDYDHFGRTWAERVLDMRKWMTKPTRRQVIEEYNRDIRVQCPGCNQGHEFEGK